MLEANSGLNLAPSQANYVDHKALFSGKPAGDPATPARVWRLPSKTYEMLIFQLGYDLKLGLYPPSHGSALRAPWSGDGYSTAGRIDEAEIENNYAAIDLYEVSDHDICAQTMFVLTV